MIAIVGAGISGLTVAHHLRAAGVEHIVFEAASEAGGVIRTRLVDGIPLDLGPQRVRLTTAVRSLVEAVGLERQVLTAPVALPLWAFRDGRLRRIPLSVGELLATDLISWRAKGRLLMEPATGPLRHEESAEDYLVRSFGREAYEAFLGPLFGGLYASDPAAMLARHGLRGALDRLGARRSVLAAFLRRGARDRTSVPAVSFREGMGALTRALAESCGHRLRLGCPVAEIRRREGRWRVTTGGGGTLDAAAVVLAAPPSASATVLAPASGHAADRLRSLTVNRLVVVHLTSDCDLTGWGYQVAFGEPLATRGVTWNASIFGRARTFTAYLGGMMHPDVATWDDERVAAAAASEFCAVTGFDAEPILVTRVEVPAWDRSWTALEGLRLPDGVVACAGWSDRPGIPGRVHQAERLARRLVPWVEG